ncbi:U3 snoRNA-associated protein 15 [Saitoella complicata NRRL Y-17804]|uniref:U3 small nucleolar RNA-associated protein 15 C-terminal domain-containing protein n=1 Tax=Saitoella complicata (strain BCRC 22490 / CBS 7301 / JCM 7358 / NBRC 10748 / NRRL Y-17804) TaxID=698492 RepID=A0A0E9NJY5_SAICN|nr:U3 snoRNA-associated protein 15 [Saitoella complicata NRRL Y-17804]ODQ50287.1 U3 snoRNA-associated protein 15 [Saitoella complicata NRRL Y-17804]GAO50154.1 hypothetical protein G7K_4288-t1 [Saitoella complicata NRRL Y-17804]
MATAAPRLQPLKLPVAPAQQTPEQRYWRTFKSPLLIKEYGSVTHIHFSPNSPYDFAVTASTRVQIYSAKTRQVTKTISRFKEVAYGGELRQDGKLLVAGDAAGLVQIFDVGSRNILRSLQGHILPVHVTKFSPENLTTLLTASDDKTVRLWDIPTQTATNIFSGHEDYVRAACFVAGGLVASGSYDGTVRLWDPRVKENGGEVGRWEHGEAVDAILSVGTAGTTLVSAGGDVIKVWDITTGRSEPVRELRNHRKGVTCLAQDKTGSRVLSGGLDGHVKIYETRDWKVVHGVKYSAPLLSVALSPDDKHIVAGMTTGLLSIRTRPAAGVTKNKAKKDRTSANKRIMRGTDYKPDANSGVVEVEEARRKRLRAYDKHLRAFRYADALDSVLTSATALTILTVLTEIRHRSGLRQALQNRDQESLAPILRWCTKWIRDARYVNCVSAVMDVLLDIYGGSMGSSAYVDDLVLKLADRVEEEVFMAEEAKRMEGVLEGFFLSSV